VLVAEIGEGVAEETQVLAEDEANGLAVAEGVSFDNVFEA